MIDWRGRETTEERPTCLHEWVLVGVFLALVIGLFVYGWMNGWEFYGHGR